MQDFASYRNPAYLGDSEPEVAEWTPDIPSLMMGVFTGAFVVIVGFKVVEYRETQAAAIEVPVFETVEEKPFKFDFYEALKVYEVFPRGVKN